MLTAHNLSKSYNLNQVLQNISFSINPGERVGLIGPNGCGKTTLLRILIGEERPDSGHVTHTPSNIRIGYLGQGYHPKPGLTFGEVVRTSAGDPQILEDEIKRLAAALTKEPENKEIQLGFDEILERIQQPSQLGQVNSLLSIFELDRIPDERLVSTLSGGQKTRLSLALLLLSDPQILLLDEPTNHLDIGMLEWLEDWLNSFHGAALIVTHDRTFLESTVTRILALDPDTKHIQSYDGTYTDYIEQVTKEHEKQWSMYKEQVAEIRRMKRDIAKTKEQARQVEITTTSREPGVRRYAKKVATKAKSREKKLERYLESDEIVEKPKPGWQLKLEFENPPHLGKDVLTLDYLTLGYSGNEPLLEDVSLQVQAGQRIALTGPNGMGKTTLLRAIIGEFSPSDGYIHLGSSVRIGYLSQEGETLNPESMPVNTIQDIAPFNHTETRNFLHHFLFTGDEALKSIKYLSYGERARLMLAKLVAQGCNFLLLDEPINHLDIPSREQFEQALLLFNGTILAVVHDRYFIKRFATDLWTLKNKKVFRKVLSLG